MESSVRYGHAVAESQRRGKEMGDHACNMIARVDAEKGLRSEPRRNLPEPGEQMQPGSSFRFSNAEGFANV
jgi:hypothetical protein